MTFITKLILHFCLFTVIKVLTEHDNAEYERFKTFETIFDFIVELRNASDDIVDYAKTIQALFCPEQPLCTNNGIRNRTDVMDTLPKTIVIGTEAYRIEEVHKIVGACCLPCSCDRRNCQEDGNCCLSKVVEDALRDYSDMDDRNTQDFVAVSSDLENDTLITVNSECIKASWLSYRDKNAPEIESDLDIPSYFMITQCFENTTRESDVSKCESPPEDDSELLLPVTSSVTGRIYWNSYCARCNNDEADILPWIPTAKFNYDISYFINGSHDNRTPYPKTHNGVLRFIAELGNIIYTPPFPNEKKLCLRRDALFTCKSPGTRSTSTGWLKRACERIYSPVIIKDYLGKPYPFLNIFCYLFSCRNQYMFIQPSDKQQCGDVEYNEKGLFEGLTAILDYKALDRSNNDKTTEARQDKCHCDELYDVYLHICRRVYCPAGDFMVDCQCVQPLKMVYGMPVLLTLKMILKSGDLVTLERKQIPKYHETLRRILRAITENISVDFIGLFECRAGLNVYYLSLVVVRSFSGHDSKETIKPFLDYLDNKKLADMKIRRTTYSVGLTSRIRLWKEANITHYFSKFADLEAKVPNYTVLFSTNDMYMAYDQKFQILSPLLYCRQIQLNETEFKENDERLTTLLTPRSIILSYYNRVSPSEVRVCADHYISKHHRNTGNKLTYSVFYMYITLLLIL